MCKQLIYIFFYSPLFFEAAGQAPNVAECSDNGVRVLVTTDVLARGVHFPDVRLIVNLNLPPALTPA